MHQKICATVSQRRLCVMMKLSKRGFPSLQKSITQPRFAPITKNIGKDSGKRSLASTRKNNLRLFLRSAGCTSGVSPPQPRKRNFQMSHFSNTRRRPRPLRPAFSSITSRRGNLLKNMQSVTGQRKNIFFSVVTSVVSNRSYTRFHQRGPTKP